tara:strand:- start:9 stop:2504 length:2496 start_codon:yes stop_codon:yes gene_type:complete
MGEENGRIFPSLFTVFLLILLAIFVPAVTADGNGAAIDLSTINLEDFEAVNDSYYDLGFDIVANGVSQSGSFTGTIYFETKMIDGTVLSNESEIFSIADGTTEAISENISSLQFGYTVLSVGLIGDVSSPSAGYDSFFERTIHRLNPLNISIAPVSSIIVEPIDSDNISTGNTTISEGDYLQLQIPIINDGDFNWSGSLNVSLSTTSFNEEFISNSFTVNKTQTKIITYNSSNQMLEGDLDIEIELDGSSDLYLDDNIRNFEISVGPPPLPLIEIEMSIQEQELVSGQDMTILAQFFNNGSVDFSGNISCDLDGEIIHLQSTSISSLSNISITFTTTTKPGLLQCQIFGDRMDDLSSNISSIDVSVESAMFERAGGQNPSALGGPWHVGDEVEFSLLVRNSGDKSGNVRLRVETLGVIYQGADAFLGTDEAGEVSIVMPISVPGVQQFNWSLYTSDGALEGGMVGTVPLPVWERQNLQFNFTEVSWDSSNGVEVDWMINLSSGVSREINLKIGYLDSATETIVFDVDLNLESGQTSGSVGIGLVQAESVIIRVIELNWTAESSFSSFTKSVPEERPQYLISFDSQSNPNRPLEGESSSVSVLIQNDGDAKGLDGKIILYTQDDKILAEQITPALDPGTSETIQLNIEWPEGDDVFLYSKWEFGGQSLTVERQFQSSVVESTDDGMDISWSGILGGLAFSSVIILVFRMRNPSRDAKRTTTSRPTTEEEVVDYSNKKVEIGCPECSRQLRIPKGYSGTVRCPDCTNSFEIEEEPENEDEFEESESLNEVSKDGKIEISCPDCTQSLRIPESYDGSVRCPACKTIFKSNDSEV